MQNCRIETSRSWRKNVRQPCWQYGERTSWMLWNFVKVVMVWWKARLEHINYTDYNTCILLFMETTRSSGILPKNLFPKPQIPVSPEGSTEIPKLSRICPVGLCPKRHTRYISPPALDYEAGDKVVWIDLLSLFFRLMFYTILPTAGNHI